MVKVTLGGTEFEFATNLRVVLSLKELTGAKTLQEAMHSISNLDLDGQINLMYASYKAAKPVKLLSKEDFTDLILDDTGIYVLGDVIGKITDGLLYTGLSPEEAALKKAQTEEEVKKQEAAQAGTPSSDRPTE